MKRTVLILLSLCSALAAESVESLTGKAFDRLNDIITATSFKVEKVAVYDITVNDDKINAADISDRITTVLIESGKFQVIERKALQKLMEEQALSLSGAVESSEMVKTGGLVGVDGFFYGSLSHTGNTLVLNIRLIDTRSSAVIFSKKIEVASTRIMKLGGDLGIWNTCSYGSDYAVRLTIGGTTHILGTGSYGPDKGMGPAFRASLRANMPNFQALYFGLDLGFMSFASSNECATGHDNDEYTISDTLGYKQYIKWGANFETGMLAISIEPSVHFSTKNLFGHKREIISPFAGLGLYVTMFSYSVNAWHTYYDVNIYPDGSHSGNRNDYPSESNSSTTVATEIFAPFFGCDINVTRNITAYAKVTYFLKNFSVLDDGNYLGGLTLEMEPYGEKGALIQAGCKFYFNMM